MFLMALGWKISIIVAAAIVCLYFLFCLVVAIYFFNLMLRREKNSYKESKDLLDFNIVGSNNSSLFPDVALMVQAQYDLKDYLKDKKADYLEITSDRGLKLAGWYIKNDKNDINHPKVLIFCHGWKSSGIVDASIAGPFYFEAGYDVLIVDHQAHGHSEGKYLGFGVLDSKNMLKWVNKINDMHQGNCDIYLHGVSMGANTILQLNGMNLPTSVKAMCADCGFTSGYEEIDYLAKQKKLSILLTKQLIWLICLMVCHYNIKTSSVDALHHAKVPTIFIHGNKDNFVPMEHSKNNYEACSTKKQLKIFDGATHATCYIKNKEEYEKTVLEFFESVK